jgi:copper chaperone CopZ
MSRSEIKIEGMTCGHCAMTITKELTGLAGVLNVQVDHEKGIATVEQTGLSDDQLAEAITAAGYTAKEFTSLDA